MSDVILGTIPDQNAQRDAIHIAVIPAIAGDLLRPGDGVVISETDGKAYKQDENFIGVVDPFLEYCIGRDSLFWLCLKPNTITGMRHHWSHPLFDGEKFIGKPSKEVSEQWLREFCDISDCPDYDDLIAILSGKYPSDGYTTYELDDYSLHFNGSDASGSIPPEFWDHVENVTGVQQVLRPSCFSCSC